MAAAPPEQTNNAPVILRRMVLHVRATGGSTYGEELLDQDNNVIGHLSSWVGTGRNEGKFKSVFTLNADGEDAPEFPTYEEFIGAYSKLVEHRRRDKEWDAAAPKGEAA